MAQQNGKAPARRRRGFPVLPTLFLLVALPVLVGLGLWQLQRHTWKEGLLRQYRLNIRQPLRDLGDGPIPADGAFLSIRIRVSCPAATPDERGGRNLAGRSGFVHVRPCTAKTGPLTIDQGWSARPAAIRFPAFRGAIEGRLLGSPQEGWLLVAATAIPEPLQPAASPTLATIPNNHLSYAFQWFSFALIVLAIYGIWLKKRWLATDRFAD